ncbi:16574_t:CDS:2 [Cetraspora pellucida]|uniref:16574_t:CDS:1 n=1 Tax=Cetraspora pellucida TaxID=1433469 RepID=A0A9N9AV72_9GLOM|nr:16574_t:CDS:2 [Cetraspora pellucida]
MVQGQNKSMNRLDDIIELNNKGHEQACSGIREYKQECSIFWLKNNLKTNFDTHKCSVKIITKVMLSDVEESLPVQLFIEDTHRSLHILSGVEIALKLLAPYNNTSKTDLRYMCKTNQLVTTELKKQGKVIYYQCNDTSISENCSKYYYQLTVSDDIWLQQGQDFIKDEAGYVSPLAFGLSDKENHLII